MSITSNAQHSAGIAGLLFKVSDASFTSTSNSGTVELSSACQDDGTLAGFIGSSSDSKLTVDQSSSTGAIIQAPSDKMSTGGFIGDFRLSATSTFTMDIDNSFSTGTINASQIADDDDTSLGGFIGRIYDLRGAGADSTIKNSYASGSITTNNIRAVGGFLGHHLQTVNANSSLSFEACYYKNQGAERIRATDSRNAGGFAGLIGTNKANPTISISQSYTDASIKIIHTKDMNSVSGGFVGHSRSKVRYDKNYSKGSLSYTSVMGSSDPLTDTASLAVSGFMGLALSIPGEGDFSLL